MVLRVFGTPKLPLAMLSERGVLRREFIIAGWEFLERRMYSSSDWEGGRERVCTAPSWSKTYEARIARSGMLLGNEIVRSGRKQVGSTFA